MGCCCSSEKNSSGQPIAAKPLPPQPKSAVQINPQTLLKLRHVICQILSPLNSNPTDYQTFLLFYDSTLVHRTELQKSIYTASNHEIHAPTDILEEDNKRVISQCLENIHDLQHNFQEGFDVLRRRIKGKVLIVFEEDSIEEEGLFSEENVTLFAGEFAQFCLSISDDLKVEIATDCPNLADVIRLETCKRSNRS